MYIISINAKDLRRCEGSLKEIYTPELSTYLHIWALEFYSIKVNCIHCCLFECVFVFLFMFFLLVLFKKQIDLLWLNSVKEFEVMIKISNCTNQAMRFQKV